MPLFDFICDTCDRSFEELVRSSSEAALAEVSCPGCGSPQVRRKVSKIASRITIGSPGAFSGSRSSSCSPVGT